MVNPGFLMPDLIEQASKLSIDDLDTDQSASSISRYQKYPYAHFYSFRTLPDPREMNKSSPEYHERIRKAIKALEEEYLEVYQEYQAFKNILILMVETDDQHSWNEFILDPREYMQFGEGKLEDLETFPAHCNGVHPSPSYQSQDLFSSKLFKKRRQLAEIKGLIETGRRELARLEGSDSFIQLRNDFVKHHEEVAANCDFCDVSEFSSCASTSSGGTRIDP
ncbi:uncharacterized protein BKA55DRAFT_558865 [Fusarium redolens]|uniref:Uncharacterized protein n=1 Tax=Fusarium redolens TaxID=48865 RepID=A0A9P9KPT5_FUSRE|nr:uncharacterized protein BKA55DRAFT_558865 [Fusarium redolens]KAH7265379.1 hypothetical protein BKA55DRAFT_558865 [Fusarium redolens]